MIWQKVKSLANYLNFDWDPQNKGINYKTREPNILVSEQERMALRISNMQIKPCKYNVSVEEGNSIYRGKKYKSRKGKPVYLVELLELT